MIIQIHKYKYSKTNTNEPVLHHVIEVSCIEEADCRRVTQIVAGELDFLDFLLGSLVGSYVIEDPGLNFKFGNNFEMKRRTFAQIALKDTN